MQDVNEQDSLVLDQFANNSLISPIRDLENVSYTVKTTDKDNQTILEIQTTLEDMIEKNNMKKKIQELEDKIKSMDNNIV